LNGTENVDLILKRENRRRNGGGKENCLNRLENN
jgi:hypothetical protein